MEWQAEGLTCHACRARDVSRSNVGPDEDREGVLWTVIHQQPAGQMTLPVGR